MMRTNRPNALQRIRQVPRSQFDWWEKYPKPCRWRQDGKTPHKVQHPETPLATEEEEEKEKKIVENEEEEVAVQPIRKDNSY